MKVPVPAIHNKMKYILGILLTLIILLLNFRIVIFDPDFYEKISKDNLNFDKDKTINLINYLKNKEGLNKELYTEKEIIHLKDVKSLINKFVLSFYFLLIFSLLLIFKFYKNIYEIFFISGILTLVIILLFTFLNFNSLFYNFHIVFFKNAFWLIDPETTLIRLFPEMFFKNFLKEILFRSFFFSLFFMFISSINKFKHILKI